MNWQSMDLGCLDMGCISVLDKHSADTVLDSDNKESVDSCEKVASGSKPGKNKSPRGIGQVTMNALNKVASQIKKPSHRKNSPLNWFPRKKGDSYLQRKIKMLQQVDGMNMTLDEALGDSNPHYSRVLREKIAAREAAMKVMEARKAALVEASWCRILKAARIQSKEAEELLQKAEKTAAEAFETAAAVEVIMYDAPNCPQIPCQVETSAVGGKGSAHKVTASFATVFEVDKQVAAAVKSAFMRLANCPSFRKDEFKDLLRKISQNPDIGDANPELSEFDSECESEPGSELEPISQNDGFISQEMDCKLPVPGTRLRKYKRRQSLEKLNTTKLVDMMLDRLRCLNEDELSSLATIVATCGLNAALAEAESSKLHDPGSAADHTTSQALNRPRRMSSFGGGGTTRRNPVQSELPSLDKFLVKHMSKLEQEVQDAKDRRRNESKEVKQGNNAKTEDGKDYLDRKEVSSYNIPDLGSLVKHSSKLEEKENEEAKNSRKSFEIDSKRKSGSTSYEAVSADLGSILIKYPSKIEKEVKEMRKESAETSDMNGKDLGRESKGTARRRKDDVPDMPSLDQILVKHVSKLEREVQEAKNRKKNGPFEEGKLTSMKNKVCSPTLISESDKTASSTDHEIACKENVDTLNKEQNQLEREKLQSSSLGRNYENYRHPDKHGGNAAADCQGLDRVLVKHVSRLEKEKLAFSRNQEERKVIRSGRNSHSQVNEEGSLDQILVKHKSRLEREKMACAQQPEEPIRLSVSRREARERELQDAWGGLSLGNSIRPHLSKLERDKAAWIKAEEQARRRAMEEV